VIEAGNHFEASQPGQVMAAGKMQPAQAPAVDCGRDHIAGQEGRCEAQGP
jgi:hypothetical protein